MVSKKELARLQTQKELLVAQCDLHRSIFNVECARLRGSFDWLERGSDLIHRAKPWLPFIAPVAGFVIVRRWKQVLRLAGRTMGWKVIWRLFRQ